MADDAPTPPDYSAFFLAAAQAVVQVVLLSTGGVILQRLGKMGSPQRATLTALAFYLLLPALNFNGVLEAVASSTSSATFAVLMLYSVMVREGIAWWLSPCARLCGGLVIGAAVQGATWTAVLLLSPRRCTAWAMSSAPSRREW